MSCGNEDNAWDNNIPIITPNEQSDSSGLLKSQITDIINYSKINFDENFNNIELYKNLILSPKWEKCFYGSSETRHTPFMCSSASTGQS